MILVSSVRSSGATTTALMLAGWLRRPLVVEADPDGGVLAVRYGLGREPGLLTLAAARAADGDSVFEHAQLLPGETPALVAPESPERCTHLLRTAGEQLAATLAHVDSADVVIDAGRLGPSSPAWCFAPAARAALVLTRPRADELVAAAERVATLEGNGTDAALVLVGSGVYGAADVAAHFGCTVAGSIADDPRAARILADGGSAAALARSALARTTRQLLEALVQLPACAAPARNGQREVLA